jgi:cell wall assembly regulator SMI1
MATRGEISKRLSSMDAALARSHPAIHRKLRRGASQAKLRALAKVAGAELPEAFVAFFAWHDGAPSEVAILDGLVWPSAEGCARLKTMMDGILDDGHYASWAEHEWWSPGWVPFADDESGYRSLVLDLHGSFGGKPGQVLVAGAKDPGRVILAPSFDAWLQTFAKIVEGDLFTVDDPHEPLRLSFDRRAEALFRKRKGYPRICEPRPVELVQAAADAPEAARSTWPAGVAKTARWLIGGEAHWLIDVDGKSVTTWTGKNPAKLTRRVTKAKTAADAQRELDKRLRKKLSAGFAYGVASGTKLARGEPVCVVDVGDGCNAEFIDLSPDGRTLAVGTMFREARGARISLIDVASGTRRELHRFDPAGVGQTFVHRVAFDKTGARVFVQLNTGLWQLPIDAGAPKLLADTADPRAPGELFNPFVSKFCLDAARERMLVLNRSGIVVRAVTARGLGTRLLTIPARRRGKCEYREVALSPSGELVVAVHRSRGVIYGHADAKDDATNEIQIWSVSRAEQLRALSYGDDDMLVGIGVSPDDAKLVVGNYRQVIARDLVTGKRAWARDARVWAYSADGAHLALGESSTRLEVRAAKTNRKRFTTHESLPWATGSGEIQRLQAIGFSADGSRLFEGGGSGRAYVWAVGA